MNNVTSLELGERLKQVRKAKELSQENVAYAIDKHTSVVSRIESGQVNPSTEVLDAIRRFLEIEKAPLLLHEVEIYKNRLLMWEALLDANRVSDAKDMQPECAVILDLPYEYDLILRYLMLETRLLFKESNYSAAEENLNRAETLLPGTSNESLYAYQINRGFLFLTRGDYKSAVKCYRQCLDNTGDRQPEGRVLEPLAHCYLLLGKYHHAIRYMQHARLLHKGGLTDIKHFVFSFELAVCYAKTGEHKGAEIHYGMALKHAQIMGDQMGQAGTLAGMGEVSFNQDDYHKALNQLDAALEMYNKIMPDMLLNNVNNTVSYIDVIFRKALCLIKMGRLNEYQEVIEQGRPIAAEHEILSVMLEAVYHLGRLTNTDSIYYLENTAIPYLLSCGGPTRSVVLDLCKELEAYYKKKKSKTKAAYMAAIIRDIYEDMFIRDVE